MNQKRNKAFTLVELIVVITILAILGTIAFISLQGYSRDARDSLRISDMSTLRSGLEVFVTTVGIYPEPTGGVEITYSGSEVWTQGTVGDSVVINLSQLNKKPIDPLTGNEYTYSRLNTKKEYELGGIIEGDLAYNPIITQVNAADNVVSYVKGTYNGVVAKVNTGGTDYILAIPSIITSDITEVDIQNILQKQKLVFNGYNNIPSSYEGYTSTGGFDYNPSDIVVFEGDIEDLSNSGTILTNFAEKLQTVYAGTSIENTGIYSDIQDMDTTSTSEVTILAGNIVNNSLGGEVNTDVTTSTTETPTDPYWDNVILALHMDGTNESTTFIDEKGKTVTPYNGASISTVNSKFGGASLYLTGADENRLELLPEADWNLGTGDFTFETWVYPTLIDSTGQMIFSYGKYGYENGFMLQLTDISGVKTLRLLENSPYASVLISYNNFPLNKWSHVTITRSSNTWILYVDGVNVGSALHTLSLDTTNYVRIGSANYNGVSGLTNGYPFHGYIDDLRFTKNIVRYTSDFDIPTDSFPDTGVVIPPAPCVSQTSGLVGLWHLDSNYSDYSGNNNNGTAQLSTYLSGGTLNNATYFDGVYDSVIIPDDNTLEPQNFTTSIWFKPDSTGASAGKYIISKGDPSPSDGGNMGGYAISYQDNTSLRGYILKAGNIVHSITSDTSFVYDTWNHAVLTYDHSNLKLYLNGNLVASEVETNDIFYDSNFPSLTFGKGSTYYNTPSYTHYKGGLDDVAIFNRALSLSEIGEIYNGGLVGEPICNP